jgi:hypothetical protein
MDEAQLGLTWAMCTRRRWLGKPQGELDDWEGILMPAYVSDSVQLWIPGGDGLTSALGVLCVCIKIVRLPRDVLGVGRDDG